MARLWLVRHGESEANASGIVQGQLEFALNEIGVDQSRAVARRLASVNAKRLITSPLRRAVDTAAAVASATGLTAKPDPRLMEYDYGERSGLTLAEARERFPAAFAGPRGQRAVFPGEEGRENFHHRVESVIRDYASGADDAILVTHGGVISAVCYVAAGMSHTRPRAFRPRNGSLTVLTIGSNGELVLEAHNDVCHLHGTARAEDVQVF